MIRPLFVRHFRDACRSVLSPLAAAPSRLDPQVDRRDCGDRERRSHHLLAGAHARRARANDCCARNSPEKNCRSSSRKRATLALKDLIDRQLIVQAFKKEKFELPEYFVEQRMNDIIRENFGGDRNTFIKTLQAQNYSLSRVQARTNTKRSSSRPCAAKTSSRPRSLPRRRLRNITTSIATNSRARKRSSCA